MSEPTSDDVRLVAAALARDPEAERAVDKVVRAAAAGAARRLGGDGALADEIAQRVAERLWIGRPGGEPALRGYTGEAPLSAWLRVIAYREGVDLLRDREAPGDDALIERVVGGGEPHLAMAKAGFLAVFKRCFGQALAGLSLHDRDLVRRHYLDGMSIDALGTLHGVHRATVARWLARVREELVASTRAAVDRELAGDADLADVLALVASQLTASLSREL
jgi:RNA polymerase sigma-70 factor (ECF subfamily)